MSTMALDTQPPVLTEFQVECEPGKVIVYDLAALCSGLGVDDPTCLTVETRGRRALVTVYASNPLAQVRAVTRDDLVMDASGRITTGLYHNGRPVRKRLFDPSTGSAQRFVLFGTTGAGKSRTLQLELIAEKINGICTWLSDLKLGQSVPEAEGHVDWYARSQEEALLMLLAAVAVANDRMRRYSAMGRNSFVLGTDPLLHVRIDEANRLLEKGAPYRDLATRLIKELGRTGRSVGVGIGLAAQASHLEELGGSDTLRAMIKEGEVTLLRWSSSMMKQLAADGLLEAGAQLAPIPKTLGTPELRSQFDADDDTDDEDDGPGTQGMGYYLAGKRKTALMRHFRVGSVSPLPGKDPEILALYGDDAPTCLEEISHGAAGTAYLSRDDRAEMADLCEEFRAEQEKKQQKISPVSGRGGGAQGDGEGADVVDDEPDEYANRPRKVLVQDRILAVLAAAETPMTPDDIIAAVNSDGGKTVSGGTVHNKLGVLADRGDAVRTDRGLYAPAH